MDLRAELLERKRILEQEHNATKNLFPFSAELIQEKIETVNAEISALPPEQKTPESPGPEANTGPGPIPRKDTEIDSFEIGTPGKTGVIKIYYDSSATPKEEVERRIINAANYLTISRGLMKTE